VNVTVWQPCMAPVRPAAYFTVSTVLAVIGLFAISLVLYIRQSLTTKSGGTFAANGPLYDLSSSFYRLIKTFLLDRAWAGSAPE